MVSDYSSGKNLRSQIDQTKNNRQTTGEDINDLVILAQTWSKIDQFKPINRESAWFFYIHGVAAQYENSGSCLFKSEYKLKPFTVASPGKRVLYHLVLIIFPDSNIFL